MLAKSHDDGFVFDRQNRRLRLLRAAWQIGNGTTFLLLGHGFLGGAVALGQILQARLTTSYCSTDRLCRCGAAVKNLPRSAPVRSGKRLHHQMPGLNT